MRLVEGEEDRIEVRLRVVSRKEVELKALRYIYKAP